MAKLGSDARAYPGESTKAFNARLKALEQANLVVKVEKPKESPKKSISPTTRLKREQLHLGQLPEVTLKKLAAGDKDD